MVKILKTIGIMGIILNNRGYRERIRLYMKCNVVVGIPHKNLDKVYNCYYA